MKKFFNFLLVAVVMMAVASCSNGASDLLSKVPAKVDAVVVADVEGVVSNLGIKYSEDGVTLPDELEALFGNNFKKAARAMAGEKLTELTSMVDLSCVVGFRAADGEIYGVIKLKDEDALNDLLSKNLDATEKSGYKVYSVDGSPISVVAVKDGLLWVTNSSREVDGIEAQIKNAEEKSIASVDGVGSFLSEDKNVVAVVSADLMAKYNTFSKDGWVRCFANIENFNLKMEFSQVNDEGAIVKLNQGLEKLNGDILAKMPKDAVAAVAVSVNKDMVEKIDAALMGFMSGSEKRMYEMLRPYIQTVDGTVMVAVSATDLSSESSLKNPKNFKGVMMVPMAENKIDEAISLFSAQMGEAGTKEGNFNVITKDGVSLKYGKEDGCLAIVFGKDVEQGGCDLEDEMDGGYSAVALDVKGINSLTKDVLEEASALMKLNEESLEYNISVKFASK